MNTLATSGRRGQPSAFELLFGVPHEAVAQAPGGVTLLGEVADGGLALAAAVPQRTGVEVAPTTDRRVTVVSDAVDPPRDRFEVGREAPTGRWIDHVQGVTWALAEEGHATHGFVARVSSTVPVGGALASSAALRVALARALRELFGLALDDREVARVAHRAASEFVGAAGGVMDSMAASLGGAHAALFFDARAVAYERVALPPSVELVVADAGVAPRNDAIRCRARRDECARAALALGVPELRDVAGAWQGAVAALPQPLNRRARHVVAENARVLEAVAALRDGDSERVGELMAASHRSLRDDFEASIPAVDALVESAAAQPDTLGARLTGGGFGGAVVALVRAGAAERVAGAILREARRDRRAGVRVLVPWGVR